MSVEEQDPFERPQAAPPERPRRPRFGAIARPGVLIAVALGGALGAPARYEISLAVHMSPGTFPWATFWINVTGAFVLGMLLTLVIERWPPTRYVRPFVGVGFLGAYTTWSTFMVDADLLVKDGNVEVALAYVVASLVVGLTAAGVGMVLARQWPRGEGSAREARG